MKQVSVISDLCVDILIRGNVIPRYNQEEQLVDDYELELGGSAAIFASQFAKLGGHVTVYGLVGADLFGEFLLEKLEKVGVHQQVRCTDETKTSVGLGLIRGSDRAMLTYNGSMAKMRPEDIFTPSFFSSTDHLHICSYFLLTRFQPFWPEVIRKLKKKGATVSLDTNWAPDGNWEQVLEILPLVDVFLPNEQEAINISNEAKLQDAGEWLALHGPEVVVKCGGVGAMVFRGSDRRTYPLPEDLKTDLQIADTTGAGDNFDGGFLSHWLEGKYMEECITLGMRCGTHSLRKTGGIAGQINKIHV